MKHYKIPADVWTGIVNYLRGRPYAEVGQAMALIDRSKFPVIDEEDDAKEAESNEPPKT